MTALAASISRPERDGARAYLPVAASQTIYAGALVEADGAGRLVPATAGADHEIIGVALESAATTAAQAGTVRITVATAGAFHFAAAARAQADLGKLAEPTDDNTVQAYSNGTVLGHIIDVDDTGYWVALRPVGA